MRPAKVLGTNNDSFWHAAGYGKTDAERTARTVATAHGIFGTADDGTCAYCRAEIIGSGRGYMVHAGTGRQACETAEVPA